MAKLTAYSQTSGKIKYTSDTIFPGELVGEFITAEIANGEIDTIDVKEAESSPGVVKVILAKDIPGVNSVNSGQPVEKLLTDGVISFAGQPIGLVFAKSPEQAKAAIEKVRITYKNTKKPILTFDDAIKQKSFHPSSPFSKMTFGDTRGAIGNAQFKLKGCLSFGTQVHFYMEPLFSVCSKTDDGYKIDCTTQHIDKIQTTVRKILNLKNSSCLDIEVKQLGGAFGGKLACIHSALSDLMYQLIDREVHKSQHSRGSICSWHILHAQARQGFARLQKQYENRGQAVSVVHRI